MRPLPLRRISVVLFICLILFLYGCAGNNAELPAQPDKPALTEQKSAGQLEGEAGDGGMPPGQTLADDGYFDDDYFDEYEAAALIPDPIWPWNRFWFKFNDIFITYAARPVSKGYEFVTPAVARKGLANFFYNLRAPVRIINCLLQGKGQEAGVEFSSFFLNTIAGVGGFVDMASQYKPVVPATGEDFGQTLGVWGVGEGIYLVWPFLGPSNVRETFGTAGNYVMDWYTNPIIRYGDLDWEVELGLGAFEVLNGLGNTLSAYDAIRGMAIDPYIAVRDGYTQMRRGAVAR